MNQESGPSSLNPNSSRKKGPNPSKPGFLGGRIGLLSVIAVGLFLGYLHQQRRAASNLNETQATTQNAANLQNATIPARIVLKAPSELIAGNCTSLKVQLEDDKGNALKSGAARLKVKDMTGTYLTFFSGPQCNAKDLPTLEVNFSTPTDRNEVFLIANRTGKLSFEAYNPENKEITVEGEFPLVKANPEKLKPIFQNTPTFVREYEPFAVSIKVTDIMGNEIPHIDKKVALYFEKKGESPLKMGEAALSGNTVEFKNVIIDETPEPEVRLKAMIDETSVISAPIKKEPFRPRTVLVNVAGMQQFKGKFMSAGSIELLGKVWKIRIEGSKKVITVNGKDYLVEVPNTAKVNLKPL